MKSLWQILEPGPKDKFPDVIFVIVEVPKGTMGKYELDLKTGALILDRDLYTPMIYPGDYGVIPQTFCEDEDPTDALVLVSNPHYPGTVIPSRPIALMKMRDEKGRDNKVLCVPEEKVDPNFKEIKDLKDVPKKLILEIESFFKHYKELEPGKWVKIEKWEGKRTAQKYILETHKFYQKKFPKMRK